MRRHKGKHFLWYNIVVTDQHMTAETQTSDLHADDAFIPKVKRNEKKQKEGKYSLNLK